MILEVDIDEENSDYTAKQLFSELSKKLDNDSICEIIVSMSCYLNNEDKIWCRNGISSFISK